MGGASAIDASCAKPGRRTGQMLIHVAMLTRDLRPRSDVRRCRICYDVAIKTPEATVIATLIFVDRVMASAL